MTENTLTPAPRIEKVLRVVDTREVEEIGDRFVPIPGTGELNACGRCGRLHEIHATVLLSNGFVEVVGVSCMKGESLEVASRVRSMAGRATRIAKLAAEIARNEARLPEALEIEASVRANFVPEFSIEVRERRPGRERDADGPTFEVLHCGPYASRWLTVVEDSPELRADLADSALHWAIGRALLARKLEPSHAIEFSIERDRRSLAKLEAAQAAAAQ